MRNKLITITGILLSLAIVLTTLPVSFVAAPASAAPMAQFDDDTPLVPTPLTIAEGTGIALGGASPCDCGKVSMTVTLPADVTVTQVLLYWYGALKEDTTPPATAQIGIDVDALTTVTGAQIGGPAYFFSRDGRRVYFSSFRADVTTEALAGSWLTPGGENLLLIDLPFTTAETVEEGAGLLVIYDDGRVDKPNILIAEGLDLAFFNFPEAYRQTTVPVPFSFAASQSAREARVFLMIGSEGDPNYARRPNDMNVTVGSQSYDFPCFGTCTSLWWDSHDLGNVPVPPGVGTLSVQVASRPVDNPPEELGASLAWVAAAVIVPQLQPAIALGREAANWSYTVTNQPESDSRVVNIKLQAGPGVAISCPMTELDPGNGMTCSATGPAAFHARAAWVYGETEDGRVVGPAWVEPD
jgi:hypothetical protein